MAAEVGPIYCAEQIAVPPNLADVLKNYTKEVLRKQPADLLEFSATYFNDLAQASKGISTIVPPTTEQLQAAYQQLEGKPTATIGDLEAACAAAGVVPGTLARALQAACVSTSGPLDVPQALLLLLTLGCGGFAEVVAGTFKVFGEPMAAPLFTQLLALVGSRDQENAGAAVQEEAAACLAGLDSLSYADLAACPTLWGKLGH